MATRVRISVIKATVAEMAATIGIKLTGEDSVVAAAVVATIDVVVVAIK